METKKLGRKQYPSELNTKAIACRVPIEHYVQFLKEARDMQCSISDWLLTKVYEDNILGIHDEVPTQQNARIAANRGPEEIRFRYKDVIAYLKTKGYPDMDEQSNRHSAAMMIGEEFDEDCNEIIMTWKDWIDRSDEFYEKLNEVHNRVKEARTPELTDIKYRIDQLLKNIKGLTEDTKRHHKKRIADALRVLEGYNSK
jgi:hypothetical protein